MPDTLSPTAKPPKSRDKDLELGRLCAAIHQARLQLRFVRQKRMDMVREVLGVHYSEDAAEKAVPVNLMAMAQNILGRKLVPKNPRLMLSTFERRHQPATDILEQWANEQIDYLNLANTFRRIVTDALYFIGIAKVGIATPADAQTAGWTLDAGQPFIERVDLDDFVYDLHAKDFSECGYMGHRVRVPLSVVHGSTYYGKDRKQITAEDDRFFNLEGDERIGVIGRGYQASEEYEDFVDLWEIYLRREKLIVTLRDDALTGVGGEDTEYGEGKRRALRVQKWVGPDCGPYHILGYGAVPGNPMAKGPLHDIYDLHLSINNIARKLIRQAHDTKRLTLVQSGRVDSDGKRINETPDGHSAGVEDPKSVQQVVLNEPNQALALLMDSFIQRASWLIGNLELMGGLGPQAKTATQDRLNSDASSANIGSLQDDTLTFVSATLRSWLWLHHNHPTNVHKVTHTIPELPRVQVVRRSFPDNPDVHGNDRRVVVRSHDFEDMQIKVDPYSLQHQTPQSRAQTMIDAVRNIYLPMAQLAQQQGVGLDLNAFFRKLGKYTDDPDLEEIFSYMEKPPPEEAGGGAGAGVGPVGTAPGSKEPTEIIRRSLGAESQQAKEALIGNAMKGAANGQARGPMMGA